MNYMYNIAELLCWDNEGEVGEDAAKVAEAEALKQAEADKGRVFTQDEVNKFVADRNKALKAEFEKLNANYEKVLQTQELSTKQRQQLEQDRENLRREMMTEKERLEDEKRRAEARYQVDLDEAKKVADRYKSLYHTSTIHREIMDAQAKHQGFDADQFISYLGPKAEMQFELDAEGNPTGREVPRIKWESLDKESGSMKVVYKTPEEAVEEMKANTAKFGNMFQTNVAAGIGAGTAPGQDSGGRIDPSRISTEEYMKLAETKEGRRRLGLE